MSAGELTDALCARLSDYIAGAMGLHFPSGRWSDLRRGMTDAAAELGYESDAAGCAERLLAGGAEEGHRAVLAAHLTIGETYFFRERRVFDELATRVLPGLVQARRGREQRLRLWSAGCCSGEEVYSLAMLVHQALPDPAGWEVHLLGTDLNPRFLQKAADAVYGEWSFRDTPAHFKTRYFHLQPDGRYAFSPEIRAMVRFSALNLADNVYPSPASGTDALDVILCRNVLLYFEPAQAAAVLARLRRALDAEGWLGLSANDPAPGAHAGFRLAAGGGLPLYRKVARPAVAEAASIAFHETMPIAEAPSSEAATSSMSLRPVAPCGASAAEAACLPTAAMLSGVEPPAVSQLARTLANEGRLGEALASCERWVAADKLDSGAHYLRAVVLIELGEIAEARRSLRHALYLRPDFTLAHFSLGKLAWADGRGVAARLHFHNALASIGNHAPGEPVPEADGLAVGRLRAMIAALVAAESPA